MLNSSQELQETLLVICTGCREILFCGCSNREVLIGASVGVSGVAVFECSRVAKSSFQGEDCTV